MVEANDARIAIRDELRTLAESYLARWEEFSDKEYVRTVGDFELTARQTEYSPGVFLTINKAKVPGLTVDMYIEFRQNGPSKMPLVDPKMSVTPIGDFEGQKAAIQHIKMPMMMTNRSIPVVNYRIDEADGSVVVIGSSRGTEQLVADNAAKIKKDVVGNNIISYVHVAPYDGGCMWTGVQCMDIAGSIPDMIKRQASDQQLKAAERVIQVVLTGKPPK